MNLKFSVFLFALLNSFIISSQKKYINILLLKHPEPNYYTSLYKLLSLKRKPILFEKCRDN